MSQSTAPKRGVYPEGGLKIQESPHTFLFGGDSQPALQAYGPIQKNIGPTINKHGRYRGLAPRAPILTNGGGFKPRPARTEPPPPLRPCCQSPFSLCLQCLGVFLHQNPNLFFFTVGFGGTAGHLTVPPNVLSNIWRDTKCGGF